VADASRYLIGLVLINLGDTSAEDEPPPDEEVLRELGAFDEAEAPKS